MANKNTKLTIEQIALNNQLFEHISANDTVNAEKYLKEGADPHASHSYIKWIPGANTAMRYVASAGCIDRLELLLSHGAAINPGQRANFLTMSAMHNQLEFVKVLINKGADIESTDLSGNTPLFYAVRHGLREITGFLIKSGAKYDYILNSENKSIQKMLRENKGIRSFFENEKLIGLANAELTESSAISHVKRNRM